MDKMLRVAGRGEDGAAKAISTDNNGNIKVNVAQSGVAIPVDLQYHDITNPIPVAPALQKYVASGVALDLLSRRTLTSTLETLIAIPDGARGVIVSLLVHGITGQFTAGQGCKMWIRLGAPKKSGSATVSKILDTLVGDKFIPLTAIGNNTLILHPDLSKTIDEVTAGKVLYVQGFLAQGGQLSFAVDISGTDVSADVEMVIQWLP